jgi:hypothetical protein
MCLKQHEMEAQQVSHLAVVSRCFQSFSEEVGRASRPSQGLRREENIFIPWPKSSKACNRLEQKKKKRAYIVHVDGRFPLNSYPLTACTARLGVIGSLNMSGAHLRDPRSKRKAEHLPGNEAVNCTFWHSTSGYLAFDCQADIRILPPGHLAPMLALLAAEVLFASPDACNLQARELARHRHGQGVVIPRCHLLGKITDSDAGTQSGRSPPR